MLKLNDEKLYIGSAFNLSQRFRQHRYKVKAYNGNNKFYNYVLKYGWDKFLFGIIEYVYFPGNNINDNKKILLEREQYYLDNLVPNLNTNKIAGSMLGFKHSKENISKFGFLHRGKKYKKNNNYTIIKPNVTKETISKLKLRSKGAAVNVYNLKNELINKFSTIKKTADFVGLSPSSVSKYIKSGLL